MTKEIYVVGFNSNIGDTFIGATFDYEVAKKIHDMHSATLKIASTYILRVPVIREVGMESKDSLHESLPYGDMPMAAKDTYA